MTNDDSTAFFGTLIIESLRPGAELDLELTVRRISRIDPGATTAGQPELWTVVDFCVAAEDVQALAGELADGLADGPWYCDFHSSRQSYVVFARRIFHHPRGDAAGRAEAMQHGRAVGVPESQLDWSE